MTVTISDRSVKRIFGAVVIVTLLAVIVLQTNLMTGNAAKKTAFTSAIVEVVPTATTMPTTGTIYMQGDIFPQGSVNSSGTADPGEKIGTWRMWGFKFGNNKASVSETFELDGFLGTIQGQGTVDLMPSPTTTSDTQSIRRNDAMSVSGGTGSFQGAQGAGEMKILNANTGAFRISVREAGSRPQ